MGTENLAPLIPGCGARHTYVAPSDSPTYSKSRCDRTYCGANPCICSRCGVSDFQGQGALIGDNIASVIAGTARIEHEMANIGARSSTYLDRSDHWGFLCALTASSGFFHHYD